MADLNFLRESVLAIALIALIGAALAIGLVDYRDDLDTLSVSSGNVSDTVTSDGTGINIIPTGLGVSSIQTVHVAVAGAGTTYDLLGSNEYNVTGGDVVISGNYSGNTTLVAYTYAGGTYAYNITQTGLEAEDNSTDFLDTIGTIAGVAVLIGLVILAFTFGKR